VEAGRVGEQRQPQLGIGLVDIVAAGSRQRGDVGAEARGDDRIGIEAAGQGAMLDAQIHGYDMGFTVSAILMGAATLAIFLFIRNTKGQSESAPAAHLG